MAVMMFGTSAALLSRIRKGLMRPAYAGKGGAGSAAAFAAMNHGAESCYADLVFETARLQPKMLRA